jgi:hypothetical protein
LRDYSGLTREQLEARLDAAEDVCVLFAWSPIGDSVPEDAAFEAWMVWRGEHGGDDLRKGNPHLTDEVIQAMAGRRAAIRRATMIRLFATDDGDT